MDDAAKRLRLGRPEWIQEALAVLADVGVEGVRVEPLAKRVGVTKGSFYHHFADRDDLLRAVLDGWFEQATLHVIELVNEHSRRPEERLRHLLQMAVDPVACERMRFVDVGIRDWARRDRRAAAVLEAMDAKRCEYIAERLRALGCEASEAGFRAFLVYSYILGEVQMARADSHEARLQRVEHCLAQLVLDLPGVGAVEEA